MEALKERPNTVLNSRDQQRNAFIDHSPWASWSVEALQADASFRRYFRLTGENETVLLMDAPPATEDLAAFICIAEYLRAKGLRSPRILQKDLDHGFAIIEDFGHSTYTKLLDKGHAAEPLYTLAIDSLIALHQGYAAAEIDLPHYHDGFYDDEAALFVDWYMPARLGRRLSEEARREFLDIFSSLVHGVDQKHECVVLRDYHVDNLMLVDGSEGINSCGQLDFQDALIGSRAYDIVSLLEDARRDVCPEMTTRLIARFLDCQPEIDAEQFKRDYEVLGAHRHAKVIGIFVRLCVRDNKAHYLNYLPHVQGLFARSLEHESLAPLRAWMEEHHPGRVDEPLVFDADKLKELLLP
jgi:hypothetical protein